MTDTRQTQSNRCAENNSTSSGLSHLVSKNSVRRWQWNNRWHNQTVIDQIENALQVHGGCLARRLSLMWTSSRLHGCQGPRKINPHHLPHPHVATPSKYQCYGEWAFELAHQSKPFSPRFPFQQPQRNDIFNVQFRATIICRNKLRFPD